MLTYHALISPGVVDVFILHGLHHVHLLRDISLIHDINCSGWTLRMVMISEGGVGLRRALFVLINENHPRL